MSRDGQDPGPDAPAYDMAPPNAGLPFRGGLGDLCLPPTEGAKLPPWAFRGEATGYDTWLAPNLLEAALDADPALRATLDAILDADDRLVERRGKSSLLHGCAAEKVAKEVDRVFQDAVLVDIVERFERVRDLVARYAMARAAARRWRPGRFEEDR